ncbi:Type 1 glutamine amidotransferase-like domain-containing protein [Halobacillus locisalis]|uniref:Type 1 glutamine amidotransferase-like domain-containing protein n=1 Tax=Halobacillus locisalis TaxID=220753 RepID=A0A838CT18_9BACI|nr:Type 1 glutamine amidotransferase-like domain-containing protein [Halobacillus locisalis]MBA2175084.1 Type 1 glutamine amidotransferase-like domain-containing protein [Halobacillus locisalis]
MNQDTHLFLFGSSPPFNEQLADGFSKQMKNRTVAVLYIDRDGSEAYLPKYTNALTQTNLSVVRLPLKKTYTDVERNVLSECGGIIIGGGDTVAYHDFIVNTSLGAMIYERFQEGVPVAGFSAGALISPEHCVISPMDNVAQVQQFKKGLGLLKKAVISAHFLEWKEEQNLKKALVETGQPVGYGIAEGAGIYLRNNQFIASEGYVQVEYQ